MRRETLRQAQLGHLVDDLTVRYGAGDQDVVQLRRELESLSAANRFGRLVETTVDRPVGYTTRAKACYVRSRRSDLH